ncbi:MAG TPA: ABC transporter ATP-binding protein [Ktedonobacterales bacterium]
MENAVSCAGLGKRYGSVVALDQLTLDAPTGSIFGLLGPNGAGKSTLIRLLTGQAAPTAGSAQVLGLDVTSAGMTLSKRISVLDQAPRYYGWMRGRELLAFVGELFGLHGTALHSRVDEILGVTGLTEAASRRISGYSGGMRQRLGLAQALINRPEVLFLDEPASALDPAGRHEILDIIAGMRGGATVFMSSHILGDVERVCDTVAILDKGRLIVAAPLAELQERYAQPVYELELQPGQEAQTEQLTAALRVAPWAGDVAVEHGVIRITARDADAASREILALVLAQGVALQRFERSRPTLEDIFLRLTDSAAEGKQAS